VVVDGQAMASRNLIPEGTVWAAQVLPELAVARMFSDSELFRPTAKQLVVDAQAMPYCSPVPEGTVWVVQVLPESVVAKMMPPSKELFSPTE
jgi:hypothetical protein